MKKLLLLLLLSAAFSFTYASGIVSSPGKPAKPAYPQIGSMSRAEFLKLTPRDYEKMTGRKMKLKEKIGLKIFQWRVKRKVKENEPVDAQLLKLGRLSLIFGIAAMVFILIPVGVIALLGLGLAIAGLVLGVKSLKGNSNVPGLLGVIFSSLVLVFLLLAIAIVAGSGWY